MPQLKSVSFTSPYDAEAAEIERRRALAQALSERSQTPLETNRMAGGWVIPVHPLEGLAKLAQGFAGASGQKKAADEQKALSERYQKELADTLRRATQAQIGTPGSSQTIMDETAAGGEGQMAQINAPGVAGDPMRAANIYMEHPATQQLGMAEIQRQAQINALRGAIPQLGGVPQPGDMPGQPQAGGNQINPTDPGLLNLAMMPGGGSLANLISGRQIAGDKSAATWAKLNQAKFEFDNLSAAQKADLAHKGIGDAIAYAKAKDEGVNLAGVPMPGMPQQTGAPAGMVPQPAPGTPDYAAFKQVQSGAVPTAYVPQQQPAPAAPAPRPPAFPAGSPRGAREAADAAARKEAEERAKLAVEMPEARLRLQTQHQDLDRLAGAANEIAARSLARAAGPLGAMPSFPGGNAAQAESLISSLKAQVSGMKLQAMRDASKTGGAVGQVTEREWPRLENMIVALDPVKMGPQMFRKKLFELINEIQTTKKNLQGAFDTQYGAAPAAGGAGTFSDPDKERRYQEWKARQR